MCGRFTLTRRERHDLERELGLVPGSLPIDYGPRYNVAPTDLHPIVRQRFEDREGVMAKWGLINSWAGPTPKPAGTINARGETAHQRPAFREAFLKRRCIVPADGFFEWTGPRERRQPLWFHRPDGGLLLFAGLYESWHPTPDERQRTFTIVTTRANDLLRPIHDRMPVILEGKAADAWLNPREDRVETLRALLEPAPNELLTWRAVSPLLNSPKNDYPELLEPAEAPLPGP